MKRTILILAYSISFYSLMAQCLPDRHSATWYDGWISCVAKENPNMNRDGRHWIQYDLGEEYYLFDIKIWNLNAPDLLDYGLKNIYVDLSNDAVTWTDHGQFTISQAPGENDYEGEDVLTLEGNKARYILITAIDNYGGDCYGLSEVSIRARELCPLDYVAWIGDDGDWNVASNWCNDHIPTAQDKVWIPKGKEVTIPSGYTALAFRLDLENSAEVIVEGELLVSEE